MTSPQSDDATTPLGDYSSSEQPTILGAQAAAPAVSAQALAPGTVLADRYRIVALLGRGGMGAVYRADDLRLGQPVALKFVTGSPRNDRLYHEVRMARRVSHPNVCRVHDVVEADGHRFISMEYVDGEDLATLLKRIGRLPAAKALDVVRDLCAALIAAHDQGVIHRDLKPANLMIDGTGRARVTDFGLASEGGENRIAGTPAYMAPEQLEGAALTPRTDLYAFGLIAYEIFTGQRVYNTPSLTARITEAPVVVRRPSLDVPEVDPAIDRIILRCLEPQPEDRPSSARAVMAELPGGDPLAAAVAAGETPSPEMVAAAAKSGLLKPIAAAAWLGAAVVGMIIATFTAETRFSHESRKPPEVLVDRAQNAIARAGVAPVERDRAWLFEYDPTLIHGRRLPFPRTREAFAALRPGVLRFIYRGAPGPLTPRELAGSNSPLFLFESGKVTLTDPALTEDGMTAVILDQHGSLVEFRARPASPPVSSRAERGIPRHEEPFPSASGSLAPLGMTQGRWAALLETTGLDLATLKPIPPVRTPPVPVDSRVAWTAGYPEQPQIAMRVEGGTLHGKPAWLMVVPPWTEGASTAPPTTLSGIGGTVLFFMSILTLLTSIVLARRNRRLGRGDPRGAMRLSLFVLVCMTLWWFFAAHHTSSFGDEGRLLAGGFSQAISSAAILWLAYTALEPEVRRRWPELLIGWARLLAGRFRDPLVGRDALIGIACGALFAGVLWLGSLVHGSFFVRAQSLDPAGRLVGNTFLGMADAANIAVGAMFLLLMLRMIFRRDWIANAAWVLLFGAVSARSVGMAVVLIAMLVILRSAGILALAVTLFVNGIVQTTAPLTFDPSAWFWPRSVVVWVALLGFAAWSAWIATGRRRLTSPAWSVTP